MRDFTAYLDRVGLAGEAELAALHRAHACAIPFENLDPHRGVAVELAPEALEAKLVGARRGGYCFEQNLLLKLALEELGGHVEPMLARVRWGASPGTVLPRAHLLLRVELGGKNWHADVGFGAGTLLEPIPFGPGGPYEQAGRLFCVVEEDDALVLQTELDGAWSDVYAFVPRPAPRVDIEMANWFTSTHPGSRFVSGLIVTGNRLDGRTFSLSDWNGLSFVERTPNGVRTETVERRAIPGLLAERFGLHGFELDATGRVRLAGQPPATA